MSLYQFARKVNGLSSQECLQLKGIHHRLSEVVIVGDHVRVLGVFRDSSDT